MTAYERAELRRERLARRAHYVLGFAIGSGFLLLIAYAASFA